MPRKVMLYAISTCGWCKRTKQFLEQHGVEYQFVDVDLLEDQKKEEAREALARYNPRRSFPTLVIDGNEVVVGYDPDRLREALGL